MSTKIYLQFNDIKGTATDLNHKDWVELLSCDFNASRHVSQTSGSANRTVSTAELSSINFTKTMNLSSQKLLAEVLAGKGANQCTIHFVDDKGTYLEYKLSNAVLAHYSVLHSSAQNRPTESFALHFSRFESRFTPTDGLGSPASSGYDIQTAKAL